MITMKDVARHAGVSREAVSHVFNRHGDKVRLSPATQARIIKSIRTLGYVRDENARGLVAGRTRVLAFISQGIEQYYTASALAGMMRAAGQRELFVKVFGWNFGNAEEFGKMLQHCLQSRPVGIVARGLTVVETGALSKFIHRQNIAAVVLDSSWRCPGAVRIRGNDAAGCRLALEHLRAMGHTRIAHLTGAEQSEYMILRLGGFKSAMRSLGLRLSASSLGRCGKDLDSVSACVKHWFASMRAAPTAVFCAADWMAALLLRALRQRGLRVPEDVSVIGFGDLPLSSYVDPSLTTIHQPYERLGREAVKILCSPDGRWTAAKGERLLPVELVRRESVCAPPARRSHGPAV